MKKNILLKIINPLAVFIILYMPYFQSLCFADERSLFNSEEFRGFRWGSNLNLEKYPQLECKFNHMQMETNCALQSGGLEFLGAALQKYYYSMNVEGEFDSVWMQVKDRQEWKKLKDTLVKELGDQYIGNLAEGYEVNTWQKDSLEIVLRDSNPELSEGAYLGLSIMNKKFYLERSEQWYMGDSCSRRSCNINNDDNCDEKDMEILNRSFGQCNKPGNYAYNSDADINEDECITEDDRVIVKKELGTKGYVCN